MHLATTVLRASPDSFKISPAAFAVRPGSSSASSRPGEASARADDPSRPTALAPCGANVHRSRTVISATMLYSVRMVRLLGVLAAIPLIVLSVAGSALAGPSLDDVVRGVESAYGRMNDLKADFNQTSF